MDSGGGEGRSLIARLRAAPPWVWISIILGAGVLVVSWLIYRNQATGASASGSGLTVGAVPADGTGQPAWPTNTNGFESNNLNDLMALLQYIQSNQTPNPSPTATPGPPPPPKPGSGGTTTQIVTLSQPESLNQIASQYGLGTANVGWLQSWNQGLSKLPGFSKPWWTLPAGTKVTIPKAG